jgi:hypothetical protein
VATFRRLLLPEEIMLRRYLSLFSSKVFLFPIVFLVLEYFPRSGVFWMIGGVSLFAGFLVHLFFASLRVEALIGRIPRALILIPLAVYGGGWDARSN